MAKTILLVACSFLAALVVILLALHVLGDRAIHVVSSTPTPTPTESVCVTVSPTPTPTDSVSPTDSPIESASPTAPLKTQVKTPLRK